MAELDYPRTTGIRDCASSSRTNHYTNFSRANTTADIVPTINNQNSKLDSTLSSVNMTSSHNVVDIIGSTTSAGLLSDPTNTQQIYNTNSTISQVREYLLYSTKKE